METLKVIDVKTGRTVGQPPKGEVWKQLSWVYDKHTESNGCDWDVERMSIQYVAPTPIPDELYCPFCGEKIAEVEEND